MNTLEHLARSLRESGVLGNKNLIDRVREGFGEAFAAWGVRNGDDAAAIPDPSGEGWLLLAAEGIVPDLAESNPELAGRCAVLANVNDIYAMGGRPTAMVDVLGAPDDATLAALCKGMRDNALRFGVPVVGGHVSRTADASVSLAILGRARALLSSFDAQPGHILVLTTNLDGLWLESQNYWNCTLPRHDPVLVDNLELVPQAAERGLVRAGKDVSMAGVAGTTLMLAEASGVGAVINVDALCLPAGYGKEKLEAWLRAFFSYGFLFAVEETYLEELLALFRSRNLWVGAIGVFTEGSRVELRNNAGETALLQDWAASPLTGFGGRP